MNPMEHFSIFKSAVHSRISGMSGRKPRTLSEKGMVTLTESLIAALIIALLLVTGVSTLRVTEKGTISQKRREQAYNLAKSKVEEIKAYINSQNWNQIQADVRFPPAGVTPYMSYAPTTIQEGNNQFVLSPMVRYVYSDATSQLVYVPTPGSASTPEISSIVRVAVAGFYGDLRDFQPLPTVEAGNLLKAQMVYSNIVANKTIYVGSTGSIAGYVYINCTSTPATVVEVGLYSGVQKVLSALTDSSGFYQFNDVQEGIYSIQLVSAPGYYDGGPCGGSFTNPITLAAGTNLTGQNVDAVPLPVWTYYGQAVFSTPPVIPVLPGTATPTPNPGGVTLVAASGAVVFADDGNSSAVTADASGAYTITQVRATPVAGHSYDTIEADNDATTQSGKNYNKASTMYGNTVIGGVTYIGPITVYINQGVTNRQGVTFYVLDELYSNLSGGNYPMTLKAADGTASPPATVFNSPTSMVTLNVHSGAPQVTLSMANNTSPPVYINFDQAVPIDAGVTTPLTLINLAVGTAAGTIAGAGASFNYSQFYITAQDDQGQYVYNIPVSYNGSATFGTFKYNYLRTPLGSPTNGQLEYSFSAGGNGNYVSTSSTKRMDKGVSHALDDIIYISPRYTYMAVTITNNGSAYPYGAWVSAIIGAQSAPPTTGMGNGYSVSNYFSTITQGTGTGTLQVELTAGAATTYTVFAQIVDPTSYATSLKATTITMNSTYTFTSPKGVSIAFP